MTSSLNIKEYTIRLYKTFKPASRSRLHPTREAISYRFLGQHYDFLPFPNRYGTLRSSNCAAKIKVSCTVSSEKKGTSCRSRSPTPAKDREHNTSWSNHRNHSAAWGGKSTRGLFATRVSWLDYVPYNFVRSNPSILAERRVGVWTCLVGSRPDTVPGGL